MFAVASSLVADLNRMVGRCARLASLAALGGLAACTATVPTGTSLRDGVGVKAPAGWVEYCQNNRMDPSCDARPLDTTAWNELQDTQAQIRAIRYEADNKRFGQAEHWQVAVKSGDCEDLALAARQYLLARGWPASTLRLASVFTETHESHSVLTVEVIREGHPETLVIDNRNPDVASFNQLMDKGYWFVSRQSAHGAGWVKIEGGQGKGWKRA